MRIQNFGRKCLSEITALFAEQNLSLGLHLPEGTTREVLERSNAKIEDVREPEASIELNATQKAFLVQPLSQYHFSVRLSNIIIREGFKRVGDLASIPFASGRRPSGLGRHTLEEIIKFLEENGLPPGIGIPNWGDALASEWEQECVAEIEQLQQHDVIVPSAVGPSPTFLEDELAQFVRFVSGNERRAQIVIRNYGFDGTGQKTLDAVGKEFGITRERVRQIGQNFTRRVSKKRSHLPIFRQACAFIAQSLPATEAVITRQLRERQITAVDFDCTGILAMLSLLKEEPQFIRGIIAGIDFICGRDTLELLTRIPRIARAIVSAYGCGHVEHVINDLGIGGGPDVARRAVTTVMASFSRIRWLDVESEWFTIVDARRNRLANVVRKILCVAPRVSLSELRAAIKRVHRLEGVAPPRKILKEFCATLFFCQTEGDNVAASLPLSINENLGEIERCFYEVFREHGPVMNVRTFRHECLRRGMNANTFYQYLTYSPIVFRLAREVYSLVGADVPPGTVEATLSQGIRTAVIVGSGWTGDSQVWISYRLNSANLRSGVFSIPVGFKGIVSGQYFVQSSGTGSRSVISVEGERLSGLHRPISIRGGEQEDIVTIKFDLHGQRAEISFQEDTTAPVEEQSAADLGAPVSALCPADSKCEGASLSDKAPLEEQEWQPISTAPRNRDVEVRFADSIGRYALMFPCKLTPDQGWINSWLKTPLTGDPIEWRDWTEEVVNFEASRSQDGP